MHEGGRRDRQQVHLSLQGLPLCDFMLQECIGSGCPVLLVGGAFN